MSIALLPRRYLPPACFPPSLTHLSPLAKMGCIGYMGYPSRNLIGYLFSYFVL